MSSTHPLFSRGEALSFVPGVPAYPKAGCSSNGCDDDDSGGTSLIAVGVFVAVVLLGFYFYTKVEAEAVTREAAAGAAIAREKRKYVLHGAESMSASEQFSMDDVRRAVATIATNSRLKGGASDKGKSKVVGVKSLRDDHVYYVASDLPNKAEAADKFAEINRRAQTLLQAVDEQLSTHHRIVAEDGTDITDNMKQLVRKHYKKPAAFAEYHNPSDLTVGSNSDKGELIEMCLRSKDNPGQWNTDNTLFRVHVHELAHSADFHYRADGEDGHGPEFRRLHQYLLGVAENLGIYNCDEYKQSGKRFCGLVLNESYDCGEEKARANPTIKK